LRTLNNTLGLELEAIFNNKNLHWKADKWEKIWHWQDGRHRITYDSWNTKAEHRLVWPWLRTWKWAKFLSFVPVHKWL
jgi:hypothetical protein